MDFSKAGPMKFLNDQENWPSGFASSYLAGFRSPEKPPPRLLTAPPSFPFASIQEYQARILSKRF